MIFLHMILCLLKGEVCFPDNENGNVIEHAELSISGRIFSMLGIIPGFEEQLFSAGRRMEQEALMSKMNNSMLYSAFHEYVKNGHTKKGLTFNIYDDNHRQAAIALYRFLETLDDTMLKAITYWAEKNLNRDLYHYVWRLAWLDGINVKRLPPPFITKPNYFVNSETIYKAAKLMNNNGHPLGDDAEVNQYYRKDDTFFINTNYSGWNDPKNRCGELNYFREDISLNSYAYALSLQVPFWMSNEELGIRHPGWLELMYYKLQYLYTRYKMEFKHMEEQDDMPTCCSGYYDPNLVYDNGLRFPIRPPFEFSWKEGKAIISSLDIAMRELLRRGFIITENGTRINITENNHLELIGQLIRANIASVKATKICMAVLGYDTQENITEKYNPAPSVAHHSMTQMRDPEYLDKVLLNILNYITDYKYSLPPLNLETYETDEVKIIDATIPNLTTKFKYYSFNIGKALSEDYSNVNKAKLPLVVAARQRRLTHDPFQFNFSLESKKDNEVIVRLFLGPHCSGNDCWLSFPKFMEIDIFKKELKAGMNNITWSPRTSYRFSNDNFYNLESREDKIAFYWHYFPESLLIPRGRERGLTLSVFVIITTTDTKDDYVADDKPIGFPFHKQAAGFNSMANNYRLFNVTIFHMKSPVDRSGYFSKNLY